jgi:Spy/CpxP family protein refolding chaperone
MGKKILYLALAVSLGLNAGLVVVTLYNSRALETSRGIPGHPSGHPTGHPPGRPPDPSRLVDDHVRGVTQHLGLSTEQQQEIRMVLEQHAPQLVELQRQVAELRVQLSEAFAAPQFDIKRFQKLTRASSAARSAMDSLSAMMLVGEAAVLTPEQRIKFAEVAPTVHLQPPRPRAGNRPPPR